MESTAAISERRRAPRQLEDALGRRLTVPWTPRRIVSLVPSITATLADLGLDEEVVGITTFCVHPSDWARRKTRVGGTKKVLRERVAGLEPDLILANREENLRDDVGWLSGVAPVYVTDVATIDEAVAMIRAVGELVGRPAAGDRLADEVAAGFAELPAFSPLRALYLIWRRPWMAVGSATLIHDVMSRAGLVNCAGDRRRYPELDDDELASSGAEVMLLSSEPFPFADEHRAEVEELAGIPAVLVDGEAFSWHGSRLRRTPSYLRSLRAELGGNLP